MESNTKIFLEIDINLMSIYGYGYLKDLKYYKFIAKTINLLGHTPVPPYSLIIRPDMYLAVF